MSTKNLNLADFAMIPISEIFGMNSAGVPMFASSSHSQLTVADYINIKKNQQIRVTGPQLNVDDARASDGLLALFSLALTTKSSNMGMHQGQLTLVSSWSAVAEEMGLRISPSYTQKNKEKIEHSFKKMVNTNFQTGTVGFDLPGATGMKFNGSLIQTLLIFSSDDERKAAGDFMIKLNPVSNALLVQNDQGKLAESNYGQYAHLDRASARACSSDSAYLMLRRFSHQINAGKSKSYSLDALIAFTRGTNLTAQQRRHARATIIESGIPQIEKLVGWKVVRDKSMFTFTKPPKQKNK